MYASGSNADETPGNVVSSVVGVLVEYDSGASSRQLTVANCLRYYKTGCASQIRESYRVIWC
jgi:hypothetical protein